MSDRFKVKNEAGMWLRSAPVVNESTKKVLLPKGHVVTKLANTDNADWWQITTVFDGENVEGFSNKNLLVSADPTPTDGAMDALMAKTIAAVNRVAPRAHPNYMQALREGGPLFRQHGITTPQRMAHFLAQAMQETGKFTVLRESMNYSVPRMLEIFGRRHSAKVTADEAPALAHNERALSERV